MTAENVTAEPESIPDMVADVRDLRRMIGRQMTNDLSEIELAQVVELADAILGLSPAQRASLGALLAEAQKRPEVALT